MEQEPRLAGASSVRPASTRVATGSTNVPHRAAATSQMAVARDGVGAGMQVRPVLLDRADGNQTGVVAFVRCRVEILQVAATPGPPTTLGLLPVTARGAISSPTFRIRSQARANSFDIRR